MCRILARHEHVSIKTRYCQVISRENVEKRNAFASLLLYFNGNFHNAVFTDESSIKIEVFANRRWVSKYDKSKWGKFKHPLTVSFFYIVLNYKEITI